MNIEEAKYIEMCQQMMVKRTAMIEEIKSELEELRSEFSDYKDQRMGLSHTDIEFSYLIYEAFGKDAQEIENLQVDLSDEEEIEFVKIYNQYDKDLAEKLESIETFEEAEKDSYFSNETDTGFYEKIQRGAKLEHGLKILGA